MRSRRPVHRRSTRTLCPALGTTALVWWPFDTQLTAGAVVNRAAGSTGRMALQGCRGLSGRLPGYAFECHAQRSFLRSWRPCAPPRDAAMAYITCLLPDWLDKPRRRQESMLSGGTVRACIGGSARVRCSSCSACSIIPGRISWGTFGNRRRHSSPTLAGSISSAALLRIFELLRN
jgi:hypothetical protein